MCIAEELRVRRTGRRLITLNRYCREEGRREREAVSFLVTSDLLTMWQTVVKLMRSLLMAMMQQAHKVELFKKTRGRADALHAKYSISEWTSRALCVLGEEAGWGEG